MKMRIVFKKPSARISNLIILRHTEVYLKVSLLTQTTPFQFSNATSVFTLKILWVCKFLHNIHYIHVFLYFKWFSPYNGATIRIFSSEIWWNIWEFWNNTPIFDCVLILITLPKLLLFGKEAVPSSSGRTYQGSSCLFIQILSDFIVKHRGVFTVNTKDALENINQVEEIVFSSYDACTQPDPGDKKKRSFVAQASF